MDLIILFIYMLLMNVLSVILTIYDKIAAKKKMTRIPESVLLWLAALGGAGFMLLTMKTIRHKTKKLKFMLPLPLFLVAHLLLIVLYLNWQYTG